MNINDLSLPRNEKFSRTRTFGKVFAERFLTVRGKPVTERHIGKNTTIFVNAGDIVVQLWATPIVTFRKEGGMVLRSGGYKTHTTNTRINAMLPPGVGLYSQNGVWYVSTWEPGEGPHDGNRKAFEFTEGMVISQSGKVHGAPLATKENERAQNRLKKSVRKFVDSFMDALFALKVPKPGPADCFICQVKDKDGKPVLDGDPKSHILGHMEEPYYVPSMLWNAILEAGGPERLCHPAHHVLHALWEQGVEATGHWAKFGRERLAKLLTAYIYRRLGFAAGHLPGHLNAAGH